MRDFWNGPDDTQGRRPRTTDDGWGDRMIREDEAGERENAQTTQIIPHV
jgi:hypothetical protein